MRISKLRGVFDKKYEQSFTDEVFTVTRRIQCAPPVYKLQDYDGEPIEGSSKNGALSKGKNRFLSNGKTGQRSLTAGLKPRRYPV